MRITNWARNDELAREIIDQDDVKGWYNEDSDEAVVRAENGTYVTYWYPRPELASRKSRGRKGRVLFRDSAKGRIDSRIVDTLRQNAEGVDTEKVRREELDAPKTIDEWAHAYGAVHMGTEKIGNCKESNGEAALFDGSVRRGGGAYVAQASEIGPRGKKYFSVGQNPSGYYKVHVSGMSKPRHRAIEILEPKSVDFFANGEIIASGRDGEQIKIIPTSRGREEKAWKNVFDN